MAILEAVMFNIDWVHDQKCTMNRDKIGTSLSEIPVPMRSQSVTRPDDRSLWPYAEPEQNEIQEYEPSNPRTQELSKLDGQNITDRKSRYR